MTGAENNPLVERLYPTVAVGALVTMLALLYLDNQLIRLDLLLFALSLGLMSLAAGRGWGPVAVLLVICFLWTPTISRLAPAASELTVVPFLVSGLFLLYTLASFRAVQARRPFPPRPVPAIAKSRAGRWRRWFSRTAAPPPEEVVVAPTREPVTSPLWPIQPGELVLPILMVLGLPIVVWLFWESILMLTDRLPWLQLEASRRGFSAFSPSFHVSLLRCLVAIWCLGGAVLICRAILWYFSRRYTTPLQAELELNEVVWKELTRDMERMAKALRKL